MPDPPPPPPTGEPADFPPPETQDPRPWPPPGGASNPVASGTDAGVALATPGVVYEGDFGKPAAQGSLAALLCGIVGIAFCGIFTGIPAIVLGRQARATIAEEPDQYSGGGMALVGMVLGWVAVVRDAALLVGAIVMAMTIDFSPLTHNLPLVGN